MRVHNRGEMDGKDNYITFWTITDSLETPFSLTGLGNTF